MPLPFLPILMAIPTIAAVLRELSGERPADNTQTGNKFWEILKLTEDHLGEIQELRLIAEKKLAVAEDRLAESQRKLAVAEDRLADAERKLALSEDRLAEVQKKRGWWPWSKD